MLNTIRVALFIDAENASANHLPEYLACCRQLGKPTIARCYGGSASLKKWEKAMAEYHIVPMLTPPSADKKNASDFALTIDAVSLLHRDLFDHAVIASSDADFTQLAMHIREHGKGIDGIGEAKAPARLRKAFDRFQVVGEKAAKPVPAKKPTARSEKAPHTAKASGIDGETLTKVRAIYDKLVAEGKPVTLPRFGKKLSEEMPNYKKGHRTVEKFLNQTELFTIADGTVRLIRKDGEGR